MSDLREFASSGSLFDGHSYLLSGLRSADERHAIAQLDVAIEAVLGAVTAPQLDALTTARHEVLRRMYDLSLRLDAKDHKHDAAVALAEAVRRVVE